MSENQNEFNNRTPFQKNYLNDPFRDQNVVFDHLENPNTEQQSQQSPSPQSQQPPQDQEVFRLHVDHKPDHHKNVVRNVQPNAQSQQPPNQNEPRTTKTVLKDALRQILASAVILIIGFLLLNWKSYYIITKSKIEGVLGLKEASPFEELIDDTLDEPSSSDDIQPSTQPGVQLASTNVEELASSSLQIPDLDIDIAPTGNRLIIPRINQNIPVIRVSSENLINRDWGALEKEIQDALRNGVVHYPGTSLPGQGGNTVITGHSSYFPWDSGRYKDVFALLHDVVIGDRIVVYFEQKKRVYEVEEIKVVLPKDIEVLKQTPEERLTLITCTPVGTNLKRLIIIAKPVDQVATQPQGKLLR